MQPRRHPRLRRRFDLRVGWLLAALVLAVWPAALLHEATTRHEICPEHGERLDVAPVAAEPAGAPSDHHGERLADGREPGAHEECPFVLLAQPTTAETAPPPAFTAPRASRAPVALRAEERRSAIPLLLLAPKQSPPVLHASA